jgi:hypothetical protein
MNDYKSKALLKQLSNGSIYHDSALNEAGYGSIDEFENKKRAEGLSENAIKGALKKLFDDYVDRKMPPNLRPYRS